VNQAGGNVESGSGALVALSTASSADEAAKIVRALVDEQLVACGNIVGPVRSIYRWKGAVSDDPEYMMVLKTRRELLERLTARLRELHSYECPELLALPVEAGYAGYLSWLKENTPA
jgi:periplasmic divalent cation tolerance protein